MAIAVTDLADLKLPPPVCRGLATLCKRLSGSLSDELVSVVLYGGLAKKDDFDPRSSDVNVMIVLGDVSAQTLRKAAPIIRRGRRRFRLSALVLSEADLRRSTDVFPIKFLDMQNHHEVLWGVDLLADLEIEREHVRLRCEQEIKNLLLRLRNAYLHQSHRRKQLEGILLTASSSFLNSLGGLLFLRTGSAPSTKAAIADKAVAELGLDGRAIAEVLALKRGQRRMGAGAIRTLYDDFMASVEQAADIVDGM